MLEQERPQPRFHLVRHRHPVDVGGRVAGPAVRVEVGDAGRAVAPVKLELGDRATGFTTGEGDRNPLLIGDGGEACFATGPRRYCAGMILGLLLAVALASACQQTGSGPRARPGFPAADRPVATIVAAAYSDEATRDAHGEAERVMDRLGIAPGTQVADIGAGDGYYTVRLARRVGSSGRVYATDVEATHLKRLEERLQREAIRRVTPVLGGAGDPNLPRGSIDVAVLGMGDLEEPRAYDPPVLAPPPVGREMGMRPEAPEVDSFGPW